MIAPRMLRLGLPLLALTLIGCGHRSVVMTEPSTPTTHPSRPTPDPTVAPTARDQSPKPDLTRMGYNAQTRTLVLYELPDRMGRWMLALPSSPMGVPIDRWYEFPANMDVDPDVVGVFYAVPNRQPSPTVTLREVMEAGQARTMR